MSTLLREYGVINLKLGDTIFQLGIMLFVDSHLRRIGKSLVRGECAQCSPHVDVDHRQANDVAGVDPPEPLKLVSTRCS
jgi:hypothetical protein